MRQKSDYVIKKSPKRTASTLRSSVKGALRR